MVSIDNVIVGGKRSDNSSEFMSGIIFMLSAETKQNKLYIFDDWEVELIHSKIIARSINSYTSEKTHESGYNTCEKALDLYSAEGFGAYSIIEPNYRYINFALENGEYSLCIHDVDNLALYTSAKATINEDENTTPVSHAAHPSWELVYRYYRFSQLSDNMYDAYRWMYLTLEILIQTISPIRLKSNGKPSEGDRIWIERVLRSADTAFHWSNEVGWSTGDYVTYFLINQYDNIRCKLFHSKGGHILPNDQLEQQTVHKMLLELEALCLFLMYKLYPTKKGSGGLSYRSFELLMNSIFSDTTAFIYSMDIDLHNATGEAALVHPFLLLAADIPASGALLGIDTRIYRTILSPTAEYVIKSYGINKDDNVCRLGNINKMVMSISGLSKLTIVMKTRLKNRGDTRHYL